LGSDVLTQSTYAIINANDRHIHGVFRKKCILIKGLMQEKGYDTKKVITKFLYKQWKRHDVDQLN